LLILKGLKTNEEKTTTTTKIQNKEQNSDIIDS
jgi:hypothetical protein